MHLGTEQQSAQEQIGQRKNDVEIPAHVAVMQQMMAVEAEENPRALEVALARQMHAPMHVFVSPVIQTGRQRPSAENPPMPGQEGDGEKREHGPGDQRRAVPPGHRNGVFVLFINEMIGVVGFENAMMRQGVAAVGVGEFTQRAVHDVAMERPLKK